MLKFFPICSDFWDSPVLVTNFPCPYFQIWERTNKIVWPKNSVARSRAYYKFVQHQYNAAEVKYINIISVASPFMNKNSDCSS